MYKATNVNYGKNVVLFSVLALTLIFSLSSVLFSGGVAYADNVVALGGSLEFDIANFAQGVWKLVSTNANQPGGDTVDGCNATIESPVSVTVNTPSGLISTPSSFDFTNCNANERKTVTFTATAPGTYTVTVSATGIGSFQTQPGTITVTVVGDITPPVVTVTPPREPDVNGWYNDPIEFSVTGTDASGIASCNDPIVYTDPDSSTASVTGSCTDNAGNIGTTEFIFQYDNTPPIVTLTPDRPANINNWYNAPVIFTVSGIDETSGNVTCDSAITYSGPDSSTASVTGSCTDEAGNTGTATANLQYDSTAPVIYLTGADPLYLLDNGVAFSDPGATIEDVTSGPDSNGVIATNNVDTSTPEVYSREYNGADNAGNNAIPVTGIVDVTHVNLDTSIGAYSIGDNVYVTVIDYLAWRDNSIESVSADFSSLYPDGTTRELISPLRIDRTQGEGVFTNQDPVTLVLNDDCLTEINPDTQLIEPTCAEPLLTVVVDDDVQARYIIFDTAKARIAENVGGFLGAPPRTTDIVRFAESDRYQLGGSATVKVNNPTANLNPAVAESVTVQIRSTQDSAGFTLTLNEDSINSGTFTANTAVSFTTGPTLAPAIRANIGDAVTATYGVNTAGLTVVGNDNVVFVAGNAVDTSRRDACATDQDGDGICDAWETATGLKIPTTIAGVDYFIPCTAGATIVTDPTGQTVCPSTSQKDVYLEIDYMIGHTPNNSALNDVKDALKSAPIRGLPGGAINGIVLHRFVGDITPHQTLMPYTAGAGTTSLLTVKQQYFGTPTERADVNANALLTAKRQVFHWAYFGHQQDGDQNSSGLGEKPGNDFWITLGAFTGKQGTRGQQAATLLHEIGHNFGLGHGGNNEDNCKGNYLSVMNYLFQFNGTDGGFVSARPLAYSYYKFSDINENALREDVASITAQSKPTIIGGAAFSGGIISPYLPTLTNTNVRIDWNRDGLSSSTASYAGDTNFFATVSDCQIKDGTGAPLKSTLTGYNDGANLVYNFRGQSTFDSGAVVINQVHSTTSTDGMIFDEEFQTTLDVPDSYLIQSGVEGITGFSVSGMYTDPDANTITGEIDTGDGNSYALDITLVPEEGATFTFPSHTYVDNGVYPITITITATRIDAGGNTWSYDTSITGTFTVTNANPVVASGGPVSATPGTSLFTLTGASFTDLGINDYPWNVIINWADSTSNTSQSQSVQGPISPVSHTYTLGQFVLSNTYNVGISVTDKDAGTGTASKDVTISRLIVNTQLSAAAVSNGLKVNDKGTTQVTILSQSGFDATTVNSSTVKVRANTGLSSSSCPGASVAKFDNTKDQNGDGLKDMLLHVKTNALCLTTSTNQLITTGLTSSGIQFGSLVSARVV